MSFILGQFLVTLKISREKRNIPSSLPLIIRGPRSLGMRQWILLEGRGKGSVTDGAEPLVVGQQPTSFSYDGDSRSP